VLGSLQLTRAIKETVQWGRSASRSGSTDMTWDSWATFCRSLMQDPWLPDVLDTFMFSNTEWAHFLSQALQSKLEWWNQPYVPWGRRFLHWDSGHLDFRLHRQLQQYNKSDPPPQRVKSIPLQAIHQSVC